MSSLNIVRGIRTCIQNQLLPSVPSRWRAQLLFGLQAYGLRAFQSASGNARMVVANAHTGIRKAERLFKNTAFTGQLGGVFDELGLVKPRSYVNVDHSDMHGLTALVGAVQTRKGRALPCLVEATYAHHIPAHEDAAPHWRKLRVAMKAARKQQTFTEHTVTSLQGLADRLAFWPRLVFDRGFGNKTIVTYLHEAGAAFYIRLKAGRYVECDGEKTEVKTLGDRDATVQLYGLTLRVIRSPKSRRAKEPWYILTNDFKSSRTKIIRIYYHRFEIEETFRDIKHIFEYKRTRLTKPDNLKLILWLVSLGIALLYLATRPTKQTVAQGNPKKQISWLRQAYEQLQQELAELAWGGVGCEVVQPKNLDGIRSILYNVFRSVLLATARKRSD
ncbi:MAG TPA: transposase [Candidatus Saccharimonadia bacterium]|nr:transposase [Candidatus Saccharimonadia bacterium]